MHTYESRRFGSLIKGGRRKSALHQAITANPFITFFTVATESGRLEFRWTDDSGQIEIASAKIAVD